MRELGLEGFRSGGIQEKRNTGKLGSVQEGFGTGDMFDRRDAVQESRRVAGKEGSGYEGCGTGKMLERRDT